MAASRLSRQTLVVRRLAEPARNQEVFLAQAYDKLLRCGSTTPPTPAMPTSPNLHAPRAEPGYSPTLSLDDSCQSSGNALS